MNILLMMVVAQFLTLVVFAWFNRVAWIRILAPRRRTCGDPCVERTCITIAGWPLSCRRLHSDTETSRPMCRNSWDQGLSLRNGRKSKLIQGWNQRKDFARTGWLHRIPRLFWIFAEYGAIPSKFRMTSRTLFLTLPRSGLLVDHGVSSLNQWRVRGATTGLLADFYAAVRGLIFWTLFLRAFSVSQRSTAS